MVLTDSKGYKSIDYAKLAPVLIEAIKEFDARNHNLEERLAAVERTVNSLASKHQSASEKSIGELK